MEKSMFDDNVIKKYFYYVTVLDIFAGIPMEEIERCLKHYQREEFYEACIGINQGIKESSGLYLSELENLIHQFEKDNKKYVENEFSTLDKINL